MLKTRAFLGDYEISVASNGKSATQTVSLGQAGELKSVESRLPGKLLVNSQMSLCSAVKLQSE